MFMSLKQQMQMIATLSENFMFTYLTCLLRLNKSNQSKSVVSISVGRTAWGGGGETHTSYPLQPSRVQ